MVRFQKRIIVLILVAVAACAPTPTPTALPPALAPSTPTALPTAMPPAPTALPAAATSPPPTAVPPTETLPERTDSMQIRLKLEDAVITATLIDSKTTRDFMSLLPLTFTLEDFAGTEKISYLPRKLSTESAPAGSDPAVGDIAYYAPWGNLALFYRDAGYAGGLVILGRLDGGVEALNVPGSVSVTIELVSTAED